MKIKPIYILAGITLLAFSIIGLVVYDDVDEKQPDTTQIIKKDIIPIELTGTPADKYAPDERAQHCGSSDVKSNLYITEYEIPTPCSQPISIITDSNGYVWFVQSNTGNVVKFDPTSEKFTEYLNDQWVSKQRAMLWGLVHTQDNELWFTDEGSDSIWKFSILEEKYHRFDFPTNKINAFPQKISLFEDSFLINDFTGGQVVVVNHNELDNGNTEYASIDVPEGFFTSQPSVDDDRNIWFVMWKYQQETILVKSNPVTKEIEQFTLPTKISAPNGVSIDSSGKLWIADTASSSLFSFNPVDSLTTEFVTLDPPIWTYGNSTGLIKTPITRPYWIEFDSNGNLWFNEQTANRLSVFDPKNESLVEYDVPSRNPDWSDCGDIGDCGISQNFGFTIQNELVWFTEWVENNIGVLDTSIPLPITITVDDEEIEIKQGQQKEIFVTVTPKTNQELDVLLSGATTSELITIKTTPKGTLILDKPIKIPVIVSIDDDADMGYHKILIGIQFSDVAISSYATIKVV